MEDKRDPIEDCLKIFPLVGILADNMPPRKRKAPDDDFGLTNEDAAQEDAANIIGGMKGDYRVTGEEETPEYGSFKIPGEDDKNIPCQSRGPPQTSPDASTLVFTHGAGGGLENPATKLFAEGYANQAPVVCFQGTMNLSSRVKSFETVLNHLQTDDPRKAFAVGGRSMGARAAVMIAQSHEDIKKLVLVSYPLTSPKGAKRDQILLDLPADKEVLFITGSNDNMCDITELKQVQQNMQARSTIIIAEKCDHGMSLTSGPKGFERPLAVEGLRKTSGEKAAAWVEDSSAILDGSKLEWIAESKDIVFTNGIPVSFNDGGDGQKPKKRRKKATQENEQS